MHGFITLSDATSYDKYIYYILNKEIQEFLVKIKMLFLRSLEIFISSREINLCRLDTFPSMVANRPVMYRLLDYFEFYSVCSCSYTSPSDSDVP